MKGQFLTRLRESVCPALLMAAVMLGYRALGAFLLPSLPAADADTAVAADADAAVRPLREQMLACAVEAAMPGEPLTVMTAYAAMLINRCSSPLFPDDLGSVIACTVPDVSYGTAPGDTALCAAHAALCGMDPTGGALYCRPFPSGTDRAPRYRAEVVGGYEFTPIES